MLWGLRRMDILAPPSLLCMFRHHMIIACIKVPLSLRARTSGTLIQSNLVGLNYTHLLRRAVPFHLVILNHNPIRTLRGTLQIKDTRGFQPPHPPLRSLLLGYRSWGLIISATTIHMVTQFDPELPFTLGDTSSELHEGQHSSP